MCTCRKTCSHVHVHVLLFKSQGTSQLRNLTILDVTKNKLERFPRNLISLSDFHASENCIEVLPDDFGMLIIYMYMYMYMYLQVHVQCTGAMYKYIYWYMCTCTIV